jgi:hypothetical protein
LETGTAYSLLLVLASAVKGIHSMSKETSHIFRISPFDYEDAWCNALYGNYADYSLQAGCNPWKTLL